jgi:hypothetical protein
MDKYLKTSPESIDFMGDFTTLAGVAENVLPIRWSKQGSLQEKFELGLDLRTRNLLEEV